jgi:hypothetical protein
MGALKAVRKWSPYPSGISVPDFKAGGPHKPHKRAVSGHPIEGYMGGC